ncbi:MAG: hypothetical protein AAGA67_10880 [Cyanobacteria bacterium P01_F01_bin.153]
MIGPLKNLLGGKKEDEKQGKYFVEFDDADSANGAASSDTAADTTEGEADKKPAPKKAVEKKTAPEKAAKEKAAPAKAAKGDSKKNSKKKAAKGKADKKVKEDAKPVIEPETPPTPPQPAALFSPYNQIPRSDGKRRGPGPSLDMFKDMARDMGR